MTAGELRFTEHALTGMRQRGILREDVENVFRHPQNTFPGYGGCTVHETIVKHPDGRREILRVVADYEESSPVVVTVYFEGNLSRFGGK